MDRAGRVAWLLRCATCTHPCPTLLGREEIPESPSQGGRGLVGWIGGGALSWGEGNLPLWICLWRAPLDKGAPVGRLQGVGQAIPFGGGGFQRGAAGG